jgi:hypothetical protein
MVREHDHILWSRSIGYNLLGTRPRLVAVGANLWSISSKNGIVKDLYLGLTCSLNMPAGHTERAERELREVDAEDSSERSSVYELSSVPFDVTTTA